MRWNHALPITNESIRYTLTILARKEKGLSDECIYIYLLIWVQLGAHGSRYNITGVRKGQGYTTVSNPSGDRSVPVELEARPRMCISAILASDHPLVWQDYSTSGTRRTYDRQICRGKGITQEITIFKLFDFMIIWQLYPKFAVLHLFNYIYNSNKLF